MTLTRTVPLEALQQAVYETLMAVFQSAGNAAAILDHIDVEQQMPYVEVGAQRHRSNDTKTGHGWDATVTISCWSKAKGLKEVQAMVNLVTANLDDVALTTQSSALQDAGWTVKDFGFEDVELSKLYRAEDHAAVQEGMVRARLTLRPTS